MFEILGNVFGMIISTMNSISIVGDFTLLQFSIGSAVFALGVAAFRSIFGAGGDNK